MTRELFAAYSVEGYDLTLAAPELACALLANAILVPAPIADVLAHASIGGETQRHAWITLIDRPREGDEAAFPAVMLVTATQVAPSSDDADFLRTTLRSFAKAIPPSTPERAVIALESHVPVLRGHSVQITARAHRGFFKPRRLVINANDVGWLIHDIKIGNRSQLNQAGSIPGMVFRINSDKGRTIQTHGGEHFPFVSFEIVKPAMDIVVIAEYIGPDDAEPFRGRLIGTTVDQVPHADTAISLHDDVTSAILQADALLRSDLSAQLGAHT